MTTQLTAEKLSNILNVSLRAVPGLFLQRFFVLNINKKWIDCIYKDLDEQYDGICKKYELIPDVETFKADLTKIYFGNTN